MTFQNKQFESTLGKKSTAAGKFYRDQIITTEDLLAFKADLLDEIKSIFKELQSNGGKRWLRSSDVRKMLSISPGTLQNLRINGTLPYNKVGGVIFYDKTDIQKMIESNRIDNAF